MRQTGLVQPEDAFDDVRNALAVYVFAALILEGVDSAACGQEPLFEVFGADDAEMLRRDRLAQSAHRREKLHITRNDNVIGCPLCNVTPPARPAATQQQQQQQ